MQINVVGILIDPTGNPLPNHSIRITSKDTINGSIEDVSVIEVTDGSGGYNFILAEGTYDIEVLFKNTYMLSGMALVNMGTPTPITLPELLNYSEVVIPEDVIELPVEWEDDLNDLEEGTFTQSRKVVSQLVDDRVHVADIMTTDVGEDSRKGEHNKTLETCDAKVNNQSIVYSHDDGSKLATTGSLVSVNENEWNTNIIVDADIVTNTNVTSNSITENSSKTTPNVTSTSLITYGSDISSNLIQQVGNVNVSDTTSITEDVLLSTFNVTTSNSSIVEVNTLNLTETVKSYTSTFSGKDTYQVHTNDGTNSSLDIKVDNFKVFRDGNDLFEVDNNTDTVYIRGNLRVTDIQDEDGNPIDISDGDTIFPVYQFADTSGGPWEDILNVDHKWKRDNYSINGVVNPSTWSIPYKFIGEDGTGEDGDTVYYEYQYSVDGVGNWHSELLSGDKYRRERIVTNGVPNSWSIAAQIVGDNGDTVEVRSEYSVDGIYDWHSTLEATDRYEHRAIFTNGVQSEPWSDPILIVGSNGNSKYTESRYGPTETIDGNWTGWGGVQLDTHFWKQDREVEVNASTGIPVYGPPSVVYRIVGTPGSGWYTLNNGTGDWSGDAQATADFTFYFGRAPTLDDHLTYTDNDIVANVTNSSIKRCNSPEGSPITWSTPKMVINGDTVVRGTMSADRLVANSITGNQVSTATTMIAGSGTNTAGMNGFDSGIYSGWRFWSGATDPNFAKFRVDSGGKLFATDATINGTISGGDIQGNVSIKIPASASTTSGFYVDSSGNMYANSGKFSGTVYAEHIEGDVYDSIAKLPSFYVSNPTGYIQYNVEILSYDSRNMDRTLSIDLFPTIKRQSGTSINATLTTKLFQNINGGGNTEILTYTSPSGSDNLIADAYVVDIPSGQYGYFLLTVSTTIGSNPLELGSSDPSAGNIGKTLRASIFKKGSSLT